MDSEPLAQAPGLRSQPRDQEDDESSDDSSVAWVDSDDERLTVSLASNTRLRKLRINESEDLINGAEYIKRLRRQYEQLHPPPKWAMDAADRNSSRKGRRPAVDQREIDSDSVGSSELGSNDNDDDKGVELSAQPLEKLLQSTKNLTKTVSSQSSQKLKVRPELIDMHRLKDVGNTQNVSLLAVSISIHLRKDQPFFLAPSL